MTIFQISYRCDGKDDEVESVSSDEDETTCSEMSKCTCYCSKDHSHDESSDGDSDCEGINQKFSSQFFSYS